MARVPISKLLRFEVFKRDSFKCQYCGQAAPNVLLHVDHIRPVADGGTNEIVNLITSCEPCNLGKGARPLSENSVVEKSRRQMEELQERREQLELIMEWQRSLSSIDDAAQKGVHDFWEETSGFGLTTEGKSILAKLIKRFGVSEVMSAIRIASKTYIEIGDGDKQTKQSVEIAFGKIGGICEIEKRTRDKPYLKDLYYLRNVLARRIRYCPSWEALQHLENAYKDGVSPEELKAIVLSSNNWSQFTDRIAQARESSR